jgi:KipI family sensor histidine kinase inhibitor
LHKLMLLLRRHATALRATRALSTTPKPWFRAAGEGTLILRFGNGIDEATNRSVLRRLDALNEKPRGVTDAVPAYASLAVHYDCTEISRDDVEKWINEAAGREDDDDATRNVVEIPVLYDGEDLEAAGEIAGVDDVAAVHSKPEYRVYFLGFTGGFPYLGGLDERLAKVPRLPTPRQVVPRGSVGVAAGQTGVYTRDTPGGWHLLGRTDAVLFDPSREPPSLLKPGDAVRFVDVASLNDAAPPAKEAPPVVDASFDVLAGGPQTLVQDLGRQHQSCGVSRCGAADEMSLRTANALVGNEVDAAALECLGGLRIRSRETRAVAVAGADCHATILRAAGGSVACKVNEAVVLRAGDELRLGIPRDGARAYVGVEGGVDAPLVLGSRSSDVRAGLGPAPLETGHVVACNGAGGRAAPRRAKHDTMIRMKGKQTWTLRVLPGPGDPASDDGTSETDADAALSKLLAAGPFAASPRSDRMAVVAEAAASLKGGQQLSEACAAGTIQLPPDGNPVILLADHQTTGGYAVPAVVARCDLWKVGQCRPGDKLVFVETTYGEAASELRKMRKRAVASAARVVDGADVDLAALARGPNQMVDACE